MLFPRQISAEPSSKNTGCLTQFAQITQRHNYAQVFRIIWGNSYQRFIFYCTWIVLYGESFKEVRSGIQLKDFAVLVGSW